MNNPELISVIVTSYNWSRAIESVLNALEHQTDQRFEVLIADDGSRVEEVACIRETMGRCHFPVRLIWQEDRGFRAAKARNQAAMMAKGDYFVFLDGDCIPRPTFIARHYALSEVGYWVPGNRVLLSEDFTEKLLSHAVTTLKHSGGYWWIHNLRGNINRFLPLLYWPFSFGRKRCPRKWREATTCNLGVWKKDFIAVNGFDERYQGWGYEDSDLLIRLIRSGIYRKSGKFAIPVFHLWHHVQDRSAEPENLARLKSIIANTEQNASLGVDQYGE